MKLQPFSQRSFKAIWYLVTPKRSNHRLQNANVPKLLLIVVRSFFELGSLYAIHKNCWSVSNAKIAKICINENFRVPEWDVRHIKMFHIMRCIHIIVNVPTSSGPECFNSIELVLFHSNSFPALHNGNSFTSMYSCEKIRLIHSLVRCNNLLFHSK